MNEQPARTDRGIRSIFSDAMGLEPERRTALRRLRDCFDRRHLRHALAGGTFGAGAALIGFLAFAMSMPKTVSADTNRFADVVPASATVAKTDRLPLRRDRFAATAEGPMIDLGVAPSDGFAGSTLAYFSAPPATAAAAAIDAALDRGAERQYASLGDSRLVVPGAVAAVSGHETDDEEDDENFVAIPRARPERPPEVVSDLPPMPRPRPAHHATVASLTASGAGPEAAVEAEDDEGAAPAPHAETRPTEGSGKTVLGFFSSPTEPVKAPPKIEVRTPFGIPYVLQTASVETACLKPDLLALLHKVEAKYGQKVVITSAYRSRGRAGSMHRQCAAADIIVPGVGAEALAKFARTIPGVGGVGTYCHTELVHIDAGTPRDWKYGCGSFFAMRGAPGKWGKVPAALAAAQPAGDAKIDMSQMAD